MVQGAAPIGHREQRGVVSAPHEVVLVDVGERLPQDAAYPLLPGPGCSRQVEGAAELDDESVPGQWGLDVANGPGHLDHTRRGLGVLLGPIEHVQRTRPLKPPLPVVGRSRGCRRGGGRGAVRRGRSSRGAGRDRGGRCSGCARFARGTWRTRGTRCDEDRRTVRRAGRIGYWRVHGSHDSGHGARIRRRCLILGRHRFGLIAPVGLGDLQLLRLVLHRCEAPAGGLDQPGDDGVRVGDPFGRPDPLDPLPSHGPQDIDRQQIAIHHALATVPPGTVQKHRHPGPPRGAEHEVDLEGGVAHSDADLQARLAQAFGDLVTVQVHRAAGGGQRPGRTAAAGLLQVGPQVLHPLVGRALDMQVVRVEAGEEDDLAPSPGDGDVEPPLPAGMAEGPEAERDVTALIGGEGQREQDRVPLLALRILQVPQEQAVAHSQRLIDALRIELLAQHRLDQVPLPGVEGDDPQ